jgi:hypothetical protein
MWALLAALALSASPRAAVVMPVSLHAVQGTHATLLFETDSPLRAAVSYRCAGQSAWRTAEDAVATALHRVELRDLVPGAAVSYRLTGVEPALEGTFTAAPPLGDPGPVRFVVVGDSRDHLQWARISEAVRKVAPAFVLVTGDSVQGHFVDPLQDWRDYYRAAAPLFAHVPVFAVPGNHDTGDAFAAYNPEPGGGGPYAFAWGPAAFLGLDSNHLDARADWVAAALTALSGGPLFTFQHHPPYSCGVHGGSSRVQQAWASLFSKAKVTIDFAGHDHDLIDWGPVDGVRYVVSGGGGTVLYPLVGCHCPFAQSSYGFVAVDVDKGQVTERFYDGIGALLFTDGPFAAAGPSLDPVKAAAVLSK